MKMKAVIAALVVSVLLNAWLISGVVITKSDNSKLLDKQAQYQTALDEANARLLIAEGNIVHTQGFITNNQDEQALTLILTYKYQGQVKTP
jgi:hypothetical protein